MTRQSHHHRHRQIMTRRKFYDVALSGVLLSFMCIFNLLPAMLRYSTIKWKYWFFKIVTINGERYSYFSLTDLDPYEEEIRHFIYKLSFLVMALVMWSMWALKPDFKRWHFNLGNIWGAYLVYMTLSFAFTFNHLPMQIGIEGGLIIVQLAYVVDCAFLTYERRYFWLPLFASIKEHVISLVDAIKSLLKNS